MPKLETNTTYKYISYQSGRDAYVLSLPPEMIVTDGQQRFSRKNLADAVELRNRILGFNPDLGPQPDFRPPLFALFQDTEVYRFAAIGDTHLCSKHEALDELHRFYAELAARGIDTVFHAGNWVDGDKYQSEVHTWGLDNQVDYFIHNYPRVDGITTYILDGDDHEANWLKTSGVQAGQYMEHRAVAVGRDDLKFLGFLERDIQVSVAGRPVLIRVAHGGGGGSKDLSAASQRVIDSWKNDLVRPDILLLGHYHKAHHLPNYRGTFAIQVGAFQWQSAFMRKLNLTSYVGGWIVEVRPPRVGSKLRISTEFVSYDRKSWQDKEPLRL